jgi:hypothetical protein
MEQGVHFLLIHVDDGTQLGRNGEHHMKVRRVNHFGLAAVNPFFFQDGLAARTASVAAGVVVGFRVAAGFADADVYAEAPGLAGHDCICGLVPGI